MGFSFNIYYMAINYAAKYNPSQTTITGCTQVGNIAVSTDMSITNLSGFSGGVDDTNGYIIISDTVNAGLVGRSTGNRTGTVGASSVPTYWRSSLKTEPSFISLTNNLPARRYQTPFTSSSESKNWLNSNGYWTSFTSTSSPLLLDLYPNASVAYSLRKLRTAYSGSAIRVRRAVDNTEQDFVFDINGDLDVAGIESFFGNNLLLQSENFGNSSWTQSRVVITTGSLLGPNGIDTADKLDENTVNGTHLITQASGSITLNRDYFLSIYLRAGERNIVDVVSGIDGTSRVARVNLTTGEIVSAQTNFINTPTLTSAGSGWWKFEVTVTSAVTSVPTGLQVRLTNGSTQTYTGTTGSGCYIWGAQISGGSSFVPYFKTTTSIAANAFVGRWYDQSENGNNATQDTAGNQAQIIANGHKIIDSITGKISTTWTSDRYTLTSGISPNTKYLSIGVVNRTSNAGNIIQLGVAVAIGGLNGQQPLIWLATTGVIRSDMYSTVNHHTSTQSGAYIMTSEKDENDLKTAYLNGSALPVNATQVPGSGNSMNSFGQSGGNTTTCQYAEYIYWNSEQSANRVAIETNIKNYWNVY